MAGDKQLFAPAPLRAIAMDLSGLDLRVLMCVAAHDRMSLVTGKGQGCRASNERMKEMIGCNFSRLCSTLTRLVDLALLQKEKLGRHTVYRVIYIDDDKLLFGNVSGRSIGCEAASGQAPMRCRAFGENDSFAPENGSQYIPLNGGRDSVETGEDNSSEDARFAARRSAKIEYADNTGAQLANLERRLNQGRSVAKVEWYRYLLSIIDQGEETFAGWATRLADKLELSELEIEAAWT